MAEPASKHRFYVHEIVLQEWVENEETSPFKTGSDPEVFRGKKSGGTGFYLSTKGARLQSPRVSTAGNQLGSSTETEGVWNLLHQALAVNPTNASKVVVFNEKLQQSAYKTGAVAAEAGKRAGSADVGAIRNVLQSVFSVNPESDTRKATPGKRHPESDTRKATPGKRLQGRGWERGTEGVAQFPFPGIGEQGASWC